MIAGSLEGVVNLWDLDIGRDPIVLDHQKEPWVRAVALAPDGGRLVFGMNSDFSLIGWELGSQK
jgi:hypothetical protein